MLSLTSVENEVYSEASYSVYSNNAEGVPEWQHLSDVSGFYDRVSQNFVDYSLTYDNQVRRDFVKESESFDRVTIRETILQNHFDDLDVDDFTLLEDGTYSYTGTKFNDILHTFLGTTSKLESAIFTIEDDYFTGFTATFEKYTSTYTQMSGTFLTGDVDVQETITGTFEGWSSVLEEPAVVPSTNEKITEIDEVLSKFDDNFSFTVIGDVANLSNKMMDVLYEGDKIVVDVMNLMTQTMEFGTPSFYDAALKPVEGTDRYEVSTWMVFQGQEALGAQELTYDELFEPGLIPEDTLTYEAGRFDLHLNEIDSSLFVESTELSPRGNKVYDLVPEAAFYFGEAVASEFYDFTLFSQESIILSSFRQNGVSWSLEILDDETVAFTGAMSNGYQPGEVGFRGSSTTFVFTDPGQVDTSAWYK